MVNLLPNIRRRQRRKKRLSRGKFRQFLRSHPTKPESLLWSALRSKLVGGKPFVFQHQIFWWVADFAVPAIKFCIEVDGPNHSYGWQKRRDASRDRFLASQGWTTLRVANAEVLQELPAVVEMIERTANNVLIQKRD